jgi:hypothetical protein
MITTTRRVGFTVTAAVLLLSACGQADETTTGTDATASSATQSSVTSTDESDGTLATTSMPDDEPTTSGPTTSTPSSTTTTAEGDSVTVSSQEPDNGELSIGDGSIDDGLWPYINDAADQLMASQSVARADITVESARLVQWRDASAGCPEPGMQYAQVLTDGSVIELVVGGMSYWYHTGGSRGPFPCTSKLREQG